MWGRFRFFLFLFKETTLQRNTGLFGAFEVSPSLSSLSILSVAVDASAATSGVSGGGLRRRSRAAL